MTIPKGATANTKENRAIYRNGWHLFVFSDRNELIFRCASLYHEFWFLAPYTLEIEDSYIQEARYFYLIDEVKMLEGIQEMVTQ